jgi:hypothetical protein
MIMGHRKKDLLMERWGMDLRAYVSNVFVVLCSHGKRE